MIHPFLHLNLLMLSSPILRSFVCIPASDADDAAVDSNGIKKLLANDLITIFIKADKFLVMSQDVYL